MNTININQNLKSNIDLLIAQRYFYSKSKKIKHFRLIISLVLSIVLPVLTLKNSEEINTTWFTVLSSFWFVVSFILKETIENSAAKKGAILQEKFDVNLFGIRWNSILAEDSTSSEDIIEAKQKYQGDTSELKNWYGNIDQNLEKNKAVLLCQRSNIVWDTKLRNNYSIMLGLLFIIHLLLFLVLGVLYDIKLFDFVLGILIPSLPIYESVLKEIIDNNRCAHSRNERKKLILNLLKRDRKISSSDLRQIQDFIFQSRNDTLVPDFFYKIFKNNFEKNMQNTYNYLLSFFNKK